MAYRVTFRRYQGFKLGPIGFLIIANIILFVVTLINRDLIYLLGFRPAIFLERPWTLVTNLFIHSGIWHILANMLTLYFFGSYLTRLVGERNLLIVYFFGGILGNLFYWLLGSPYAVAIGASGAVFAVAGALVVLQPGLKVFIIPIPVPLPLWVAVIGGGVIISFFPHVAWQAHLGGLVFGLVIAYFFWKRKRRFFF